MGAMTLSSTVSSNPEDWIQLDNRGDEDRDEAQPGTARSGGGGIPTTRAMAPREDPVVQQ